MEEIIKKIVPTLLVAAILSLFGAMWRFESVAGEVGKIKSEIENHYTKKEHFVVLKNDLKHIREKQSKISGKIDVILQAVRRN